MVVARAIRTGFQVRGRNSTKRSCLKVFARSTRTSFAPRKPFPEPTWQIHHEHLSVIEGLELGLTVQSIGSSSAAREILMLQGLGERLDFTNPFLHGLVKPGREKGADFAQLRGFTLPCLEDLTGPRNLDLWHSWRPEVEAYQAEGGANAFTQRQKFLQFYTRTKGEERYLLLHSMGLYSMLRILETDPAQFREAFSGIIVLVPALQPDTAFLGTSNPKMVTVHALMAEAREKIGFLEHLQAPALFVICHLDPFIAAEPNAATVQNLGRQSTFPVNLLNLTLSYDHNLDSFGRRLLFDQRAASKPSPTLGVIDQTVQLIRTFMADVKSPLNLPSGSHETMNLEVFP